MNLIHRLKLNLYRKDVAAILETKTRPGVNQAPSHTRVDVHHYIPKEMLAVVPDVPQDKAIKRSR
jgi:hypothetical protein